MRVASRNTTYPKETQNKWPPHTHFSIYLWIKVTKYQSGNISVDAKTEQRALLVSDSHPQKQLSAPKGSAAVAVTESTDRFTKPGVTKKTGNDETHGVELH